MTGDSEKAAIESVLEAVRRGHRDKDAAAVGARFSPDAVVFDLAPPLGHRFDVAGLAAWFDGWEGPVEQEWHEPAVFVSGDLAFCYGFQKLSTATRSDGERAEWWQRTTLCLRRIGGDWTIVHEHSSVPFHMDGSLRAALDLEPRNGRTEDGRVRDGSPVAGA